MELHINTVVWGEEFIKTFINIAIASQLAEGNIPDLDKKCTPIYFIYTRKEDQPQITSSILFQKLASKIPIVFRFFTCDSNLSIHQTLTNCHIKAIKEANQNQAPILFLSPDLIVSRGAFSYFVDLLNRGKRLIASLGIRLSLESMEKELSKRHLINENQPLSLTANELIDLAFRNLHTFSKNLFWRNEKANHILPTIFWKLDDTTLLARGFHIHPIVIWPTDYHTLPCTTIDGPYVTKACPNKKNWHLITNTKKISLFELSNHNKFHDSPLAKPSIELMLQWASDKQNVSDIHRYYVKHKLYIGSGRRRRHWRKIERESDRIINAILIPRWKLSLRRFKSKLSHMISCKCFQLIHIFHRGAKLKGLFLPKRKLAIKIIIKRILPKMVYNQIKKIYFVIKE